MWEVSVILNLFRDFGFGVAQTALIVFLFWKLATNHLKHLSDDIKAVGKDVKDLADEIKGMKSHCALEGERLAKLEGKIEV
jgi:hypothetical protein